MSNNTISRILCVIEYMLTTRKFIILETFVGIPSAGCLHRDPKWCYYQYNFGFVVFDVVDPIAQIHLSVNCHSYEISLLMYLPFSIFCFCIFLLKCQVYCSKKIVVVRHQVILQVATQLVFSTANTIFHMKLSWACVSHSVANLARLQLCITTFLSLRFLLFKIKF
jgi:hypothetical protein